MTPFYSFRDENSRSSILLETEEEYRERWNSIRIMYFTMFLMALGFSVVLTGVWPYLDKVMPIANTGADRLHIVGNIQQASYQGCRLCSVTNKFSTLVITQYVP